MPKKLTQQKVVLNLWLDPDLRTRLDLLLFSELEGRVPHGGYTNFFSNLLREHLEWKQLELAPYGFPPGYFIKGPKEMVEKLSRELTMEDKE